MRFISWNVNGLRAAVKKGFEEVFACFDADIFAIQETKLQAGQIHLAFDGYYQYWSYAKKKGYAGTAVFTRALPLRVLHGLGNDSLDGEGRIVALEFDKFWFVDVYTPNAQDKLARIDHRMMWDDAFRDFCKNLEAGFLPAGVAVQEGAAALEGMMEGGYVDIDALARTGDACKCEAKPLVICGDFNVAHNEIDLKNPGPNRGNAGFSDEEREKFGLLLDAGFADTFRRLYPDLTDAYSWWSYRANARARNVGWRIDYFLVSESLFGRVSGASIYREVTGSDHCPVALELNV